jgi:hypothetical protein
MWKFFKKLFSRKHIKNMNNETNNNKRKHKLEIQVLEADYTDADKNMGQPLWRPVNYGMDNGKPLIIEVADEKEFESIRQQYTLCDQRIKVIREIDPFDEIPTNNTKSSNVTQNVESNVSINNKPIHNQISQTINNTSTNTISTPITVTKPKIITVGDTQIKYDGEKVYSRQWVKLNSKESSCLRIVNDNNNKIVPLNGKHIEALRWVLIEDANTSDTEDDVSKSIESILNGN